MDHERVLATRILSQRNPSDLSFAVLIIGDGNRERVQEDGCARSKSKPCLSRLVLAFTGSHSNSYRNAAIVALHFSLNGDRWRLKIILDHLQDTIYGEAGDKIRDYVLERVP
jgi:hypothetical protein